MPTIANDVDREITLTREFAAPRSLVFRAWTDPANLARWWGPHGFTVTTHEFAFRVGGLWRHTMHGPDGTDYPNRVRFDQVVPNERLEYTQDDDGASDHLPFQVVVTFEDRPGGTFLTLRMRWDTAEQCAAVKEKYGAVEGGRQTLERLAAHLATDPCAIVSRRRFAAPRGLVWRTLTDPAHLARWWGPAGFTTDIHRFDLRPGGIWQLSMHGPDGTDYHNQCEFVEVTPPERLVYRHLVPVSHFTMTITLAECPDGTEMTWRMQFASPEACEAARSVVAPSNEQNFDKLADLLPNLTALTVPSDTEIRLTRRFAAPRELVWRATTSPELIPNWWGPRGSTATVREMDFRVGGHWRFTVRMADGSEHPFCGEYRLIQPPEKLEQTFAYDVPGFREQPVIETIRYEEVDGGTQLTVTIQHASKEARDGHLASGMEGGAAQSHDRLAELLATMS